jgi:hypothetical protein
VVVGNLALRLPYFVLTARDIAWEDRIRIA